MLKWRVDDTLWPTKMSSSPWFISRLPGHAAANDGFIIDGQRLVVFKR